MDRLSGSSKLLRAMNTSAVLSHLLTRGPLTRGDIRDLTGLSKPTTSDVLRKLVEAGLAIVTGHTSGGPGPNAEIYAANPDAAFAAAISIRETADEPIIAIAVVDLVGTDRAHTEVVRDLGSDPAGVLVEALRDLCRTSNIPLDRIRHTQLGVPGSYDPATEEIHHVDVPGLDRPGLVSTMRRALNSSVSIDNDVNLAAIAERRRGVASDVPNFVLLWIDRGLGLAIDLGGPLLRGARGGAGEIGYMPLGLPSARTGGDAPDLDSILAGEAVLALAQAHGIEADTPEAAVHKGGAAFIAALAQRVAVAVGAVAAVLDPTLVVLAGAVARAGGSRLRDAVSVAMRAAAPLEVEVATTSLDDDAVLLGALDSGLAIVREDLIQAVHEATNQ
jgi:predicted NBD/HSP70 family sugar kinase